jgi:hypothetical protein
MLKNLLMAAAVAATTLTVVPTADAAGGCGVANHRGVYGACRANPYGRDVATLPSGRRVVVGHGPPVGVPGGRPGWGGRPGNAGGFYVRPGWHGAWSPAWGAWHSGWGPSPGVFAAGVLGVAIGASLAAPYYGPPPAYYAGPGYWGYWQGCRSYWRWAPALGYYVPGITCS